MCLLCTGDGFRVIYLTLHRISVRDGVCEVVVGLGLRFVVVNRILADLIGDTQAVKLPLLLVGRVDRDAWAGTSESNADGGPRLGD